MKQVYAGDLSKEQAVIAASFLGRTRKGVFETDASFFTLLDLTHKIKVVAADLNKDFKSFKNSKVKRNNGTNITVTNIYKWSQVDLIQLLNTILYIEFLFESWKLPSYQHICSKDPGNPKCWKSQGKLSEFISKTRTIIGEIRNEIAPFYTGNVYNMDILYLGNWEKFTLEDGREYIVNNDNQSERLWLEPSIVDKDLEIDEDSDKVEDEYEESV